MTTFPPGFREKYQQLLGDEAEEFFASFDEPAVAGFRTNPLKEQQAEFVDKIPDMDWSYYGKISGKSAEHVTGLVYSQEPAAQMVGQIAAPKKGQKVLDLAAAPGGKTTHLLSFLDNTGLLVSNEISSKRAKILSENVERFGARNVVVTNSSADQLAQAFPVFFDLIVLDAPCSGEGMFRKDPDAMQYWTPDYPAECASVQKEILTATIDMLAPGGHLVYSTCTWSPEENEEVVQWLLDTGLFELEAIPKINGMVEGIGLPETARMYPHHFKGEGQFVAKLRYTGEAKIRKFKPATNRLTREQEKLWADFSKENLSIQLEGRLQVFGQHLYAVPQELPDLRGIRIVRNGLHLGEFKKKRFEPSFALGLALTSQEVQRRVAVSDEQFQKYAAGETISVDKNLPNGWYQVVAKGNGLGFAKIVSGTLKNGFPKGLRFQSQ